jgi:hypothetical protein
MGNYRAYFLDDQDHIIRAEVIFADDDEAAIEAAKPYVDGHDIEVWGRP